MSAKCKLCINFERETINEAKPLHLCPLKHGVSGCTEMCNCCDQCEQDCRDDS